ncbi:MAG: GNAT family N-acetyltransferase [Anaerolineae bacterium]|nr:GNAT family N-acetyltransferase [Anaerolineae bacterium]
MITLRPMTLDDIPLGMRLKALAGWNQTHADWRMVLELGSGLVAEVDGNGVGTATVVPYGGRFSWIGMVLVDPGHRREGIGTALLEAAVAEAKATGTPCLDATPLGLTLYARFGFRERYNLIRMVRPGNDAPPGSRHMHTESQCADATPVDIPDLVSYDAPVFGAERGAILRALQANRPDLALVARRDGALSGYCLGRSGSDADQIGPLIAEDLGTAQALLRAVLERRERRAVITDVAMRHAEWLQYLTDLGFAPARPFTRMALGSASTCEPPPLQYAIAGPEIG